MFALRHQGNAFPLRPGEALAGRSAYCRLIVGNALTSRRHCVFKLSSEGLSVTDLDSVNGTFVNGARIQGTRALSAGDEVRIGTDTFEVIDAVAVAPPGGRGSAKTRPEPFPLDEITEVTEREIATRVT